MKNPKKKQFIRQIKDVPIVSSVCQKVGISRQTYYRWYEEDEEFKDAVDKAKHIGRDSINDLAESSLINNIKDGQITATKYWLSNNHKNYIRPRIEGLHDLLTTTKQFTSLADMIKDSWKNTD
jgi:predicted DNA-binding transcriptional regulator AlpA